MNTPQNPESAAPPPDETQIPSPPVSVLIDYAIHSLPVRAVHLQTQPHEAGLAVAVGPEYAGIAREGYRVGLDFLTEAARSAQVERARSILDKYSKHQEPIVVEAGELLLGPECSAIVLAGLKRIIHDVSGSDATHGEQSLAIGAKELSVLMKAAWDLHKISDNDIVKRGAGTPKLTTQITQDTIDIELGLKH